MFAAEHYLARANELEDASRRVSSTKIKESYVELARSFREMANLAKATAPAADIGLEHH